MVDVLEKKLGDLVRDLEARRDDLRREIDRVNAQLDLIAGLVGGKSTSRWTERSTESQSSSTRSSESRSESRPTESRSATKVSQTNGAPTPVKRGRGRPPKSASAATATVSAKKVVAKAATKKASAKGKSKSGSGRTLKDELVAFAKSNNGVLRIGDASENLVKIGRYHDKAQAAANIHAAIKYYEGMFIRDVNARGVYKVKV